jgi:hypothetical protein
MTPLTQRVHLVPPLMPRESTTLVQAVADSRHQGVQDARYHNSTFVDDNGVVNTRDRIQQAIDNRI